MDRLAICIYGTMAYGYAARTLMESLSSQIGLTDHEVLIIWVGCDDGEFKEFIKTCFEEKMPEGINLVYIPISNPPDLKKSKNYGVEAQMFIAKMQGEGFAFARKWGADYCMSVEADVIPPVNALRCMKDTLSFDGGYYDVAMVTYPDQGAGSFLGGNGSYCKQIEDDVAIEERKLPWYGKKAYELVCQPSFKDAERRGKIIERLKKYPPKGNVFALNAEGFRRRGWLDNAYPGVGRGAILKTDWTGLGCVLMTKRALALCDFIGYEGSGTQDLFLNWSRWEPNGINRAVITHVACHHIVRARNEEGFQDFKNLSMRYAYHETQGETKGHLRTRNIPWANELPQALLEKL